MGYKLAGYDVIAANDIDLQMEKVNKANHHPKQYFLCSVKDLLKRNDLPQVDVLDGSPPCSVFSMAGSREQAWQKDKVFREGQSKQILDDLFFDFIDLVEKMKPKIVIAENVKGMLIGHAKWYTREIVRRFNDLGYQCQVYLLSAASMGVPQRRERVFFIAHKTNKYLELNFNEEPIRYGDIRLNSGTEIENITELMTSYWHKAKQNGPCGLFNARKKLSIRHIPNTIASAHCNLDALEPRHIYREEAEMIGSWPSDYDYLDIKPGYLIGMSVPPIMMAQVAHQVCEQLIRINYGKES